MPERELRRVTVILVNWNRRDLLMASLRSLESQSIAGFEVIVVDNGSTDGSAETAEAQFGSSPRFTLRVIRNTENAGFCKANNQGFDVAEGKYIALLNNDAEAEPQWLEELARGMEIDPDDGMNAISRRVWAGIL